jgi:hypothetical protein
MTLEFYLLALKELKEESSMVNQELRTIKMLEAQGVAMATKPEQVEYVRSTATRMVNFLLEQVNGKAPQKEENKEEARLLKNKKEFMRQTVTQGKKFGSLSEILQAVGKSLNKQEED